MSLEERSAKFTRIDPFRVTTWRHKKNTMLYLFQNLECEILLKKPTILGCAILLGLLYL
ncbi:hypothetical protein [Leptospira interrogans]|uniref:hypothetical protein n=1 Tax=Leptospira interrogans TaxID=173 RepID=UPI00034C8A9B|nr:hypothetical protein [Leptospira interrogans]